MDRSGEPSSGFCAPNIPGQQMAVTPAGDVLASQYTDICTCNEYTDTLYM